MKLKRLLFLGSILGGTALLRDKARRDRLMGSARGWLQSARDRLGRGAGAQSDLPPIRDYGAPYTPTGAGV